MTAQPEESYATDFDRPSPPQSEVFLNPNQDQTEVMANQLSGIAISGFQAAGIRGATIASEGILNLLSGQVEKIDDKPIEPFELAVKPPETDMIRDIRNIIDGQVITSQQLGLTKVNDIALFEMLPKLAERGGFVSREVLWLGFYEGATDSARDQALRQSRRRVLTALEKKLGRPIVSVEGVYSYISYEFQVAISRHPEDTEPQYPELPARSELSVKPGRKPRIQRTKGEIDEELSLTAQSVDPAVISGLIRTFRQRQVENSGQEPDELRESLQPLIEKLIAKRLAPKPPRGPKRAHIKSNAPVDRTVEVLRMHWGIPADSDLAESPEPQSIKDISYALGPETTPYAIATLIQQALKDAAKLKSDNGSAAMAREYLEHLQDSDH
jgi:hypothetical protein